MNTIENANSSTEFFKKMEPIFAFFIKLDQNEIIHLIFAVVCFLVTFVFWYWIFFKGGEKKSIEETVRWNEKLGLNTNLNSFIMKPIVSKIFIMILLIGAGFFLFIAILRLF